MYTDIFKGGINSAINVVRQPSFHFFSFWTHANAPEKSTSLEERPGAGFYKQHRDRSTGLFNSCCLYGTASAGDSGV